MLDNDNISQRKIVHKISNSENHTSTISIHLGGEAIEVPSYVGLGTNKNMLLFISDENIPNKKGILSLLGQLESL